ncbi:LCP family protein [Kitasatospora sp. HPMI-4]|uniref:LCP family protein n=1 Tax=Kitasatospora sp. HPMI-4 TaxID=3448443 RepID=UPI003F1DAA85
MTDAKSRPAKGTPASLRGRLARAAGATAAVLVLAAGGGGAWLYWHIDHNISTFDAGGIAPSRPPAAAPVTGGGRPVNVLLLGSDSRDDGNEALAGGEAGVGNSDTAMLVHIYGDHRHAVVVSIPRDTLVTIPPCRLPSGKWTTAHANQMFNSAFTVGEFPQGNPACTQNTVEALTGLRVDHTVVVDFKGFAAMTDAVHGVDVCVPNDVDSYGIKLAKGRQTLSGQQALDYVRARHGFGDGSDIGRMKRQQAFVASLIKKVQGEGLNPATLLPLADAATKSLTVDPGLGTAVKLADFAQSLRNIKLTDINFVTVPWRYSGERVALIHPDADRLWNLLRQDDTLDGKSTGQEAASPSSSAAPSAGPSTTPSASPAADLPVTVSNGSGTGGLAGQAADALRAKGYRNVVLGPDASPRGTTLIGYAPDQRGAAEQLTQYFTGATLRVDPSADGVTVTLGRDYAPDDSAATPSAPPTTVPVTIAENTRPADSDLCTDLSFG